MYYDAITRHGFTGRIMLRTLTVTGASLLLVACAGPPYGDYGAASDQERHELTGTIVSIDPQERAWYVDHKEIPGYMDAMVMAFPVPEKYWTDDLAVDQNIGAIMVADDEGYWLEDVEILAD